MFYPGLPEHPTHAVAARQMHEGFGPLLGFEVREGAEAARRVVERLRVFRHAASVLPAVRKLDDSRLVLLNSGRWDSASGVAGIETWRNADRVDPCVTRNGTKHVIQAFGITWAPGQLAFHPGRDGEFAIVRWTAPADGTADMAATFTSIAERATTDVDESQESNEFPYLLPDGVDTANLELVTFINGREYQRGNTNDRILNDCQVVSLVSSLMTLEPGDVILTGTPAGATDSIVRPGDVVTHRVDSLGELQFTIV